MGKEDSFKKIRHKYSERFHKSRVKILRALNVPNLYFDGARINGLDYLKSEDTKVYLANHRSHADYVALGYLFGRQNIKMPRMAAGKNLLIFPLSLLGFRRFGAFSIERDNRSREYLATLKEYVKSLLLNKEDILIFPEGTRKFSGDIGKPKTGLIEPIILAQEEINEDIQIVPVRIDYDNVIEEDTKKLIRKFQRRRKESHGLSRFLNNLGYYGSDISAFLRRPFRKNKGLVYLSFAKPRPLREYTGSNLKDDKKNLATKVMEEIRGMN